MSSSVSDSALDRVSTGTDSATTTSKSVAECTAGTSAASNILSLLRCPRPLELSRKRNIQQNPKPPSGKRRSCGHRTFDPKSVSPAQRVCEYPGESLSVSNNTLFCQACREELGIVQGDAGSIVT